MDEATCKERYEGCSNRFSCLEKKYQGIAAPEKGALSQMHEKMNSGFANRPTWKVFIVILGFFFALITGAFGYTKTVADNQRQLVTKEDFRELKKDILREIDRSLNGGHHGTN